MIKIENCSKYYTSDNNVVCALNNINLTFVKGEFVTVTGESGSGKTTLLRGLASSKAELIESLTGTFQYNVIDAYENELSNYKEKCLTIKYSKSF